MTDRLIAASADQEDEQIEASIRPQRLAEYLGQEAVREQMSIYIEAARRRAGALDHVLIFGPPGLGKTTLAQIVARELGVNFRATSGPVIAKAGDLAALLTNLEARDVLFIDEIHRFNKAQQDAFLPHVESGLITLIGATTENPSFEVISPLLSRTRVLVLQALSKHEVIEILKRALKNLKQTKDVTPKALDYLAELSGGDARVALGNLELALSFGEKVTPEIVKAAAQKKVPGYDKKGDMHYDVISAFIKSMRGSDVGATLYYLSRMIDAGEDPKFIARRMVIFASEDIGLAGNGALSLAVAAFQAVERVGLPEANYNLYHCALALARSKKSREVTELMYEAKDLAKQHPDAPVPLHIRNAPTKLMKNLGYGKNYKWQANFKHEKGFLPDNIL